MIPWKKKQPPQPQIQHHVNQQLLYGTIDNVEALKQQNAHLIARLEKLEAQPPPEPHIVLYKLDPQEDVLVQCVVGNDHVSVPLSQIVARVVQAMATEVKAATGPRLPRSRAAKAPKQQVDVVGGGQAND